MRWWNDERKVAQTGGRWTDGSGGGEEGTRKTSLVSHDETREHEKIAKVKDKRGR